MGKMWKLAIATWFAVVATPAPSFSVAQDRLIDLSDGRLALSFAGREVLLPKVGRDGNGKIDDVWELFGGAANNNTSPNRYLAA